MLKKTKDGFKVCLKSKPEKCFSKKGIPEERAKRQMKAIAISEHMKGSLRSIPTGGRGKLDYDEWKRKNEEAKAKAYKRTAREAKDAQLFRLTRELENKKQELAARMANRPAEREQMIKNYNDDIEKLNNYDYYSLNNTRLRDALDKQYGQMLRNMGSDMYTYGELPDWVGRDIGKPAAIKYVYEHYGQAKPNFWDSFNDAVSFVGSMIPGMSGVFNVLDTVRGEVMDMTKSQPKELEQVDYNIINEDFENQLQGYDALLEQDANEMKQVDDDLANIQRQKDALMEGEGKPKNQKLYNKIKEKVYKEQPKHSLFRSARIQKEYKDAGGTYVGDTPDDNQGLKGWFKAKWISLNDYAHRGEVVPCGNARTEENYGEYPLCRPLAIAKKLGRTKILKLLKKKNELKEKPLHTEKVLGTTRFNIEKEMAGAAKPLTARLGGKVLLKKAIVEKFFPSSNTYEYYVEPFVGGGSVYFYKDKDGHKEIINDLDPLIYTIFKGFQKYPADKIANAVNGDYTREEFEKIKNSSPRNEFEKFIKMFLVNRLSYFAKSKAFGKPRINSSFDEYKERLSDVVILKDDWKKVVDKYNKSNTFFYLDPPYSKSDSQFAYSPVSLEELKQYADKINGKGNKFLITIPGDKNVKDLFDNYNIHNLKTKYVGQRTKGGQTKEATEWVITNYKNMKGGAKISAKPISSAMSGLLGKTDEVRLGKKVSDKFQRILRHLRIDEKEYLTVAKNQARKTGYDPDKLSYASDGDHKLIYDSPQGIKKFGKAGYGDFIIWSYLERMGKVPKGTAAEKRKRFRTSHGQMSKDYGLTKYSPNELAINILW
jgi:DNA adenine methylase